MQNYADKTYHTRAVNISSQGEIKGKNALKKLRAMFHVGVWSVTKSVSYKKSDKQCQLNKNLHSSLLPLHLGGVWSPVRVWSSRHHLKPVIKRISAVITLHRVITFCLVFESTFADVIPHKKGGIYRLLWSISQMNVLGVWSVV